MIMRLLESSHSLLTPKRTRLAEKRSGCPGPRILFSSTGIKPSAQTKLRNCGLSPRIHCVKKWLTLRRRPAEPTSKFPYSDVRLAVISPLPIIALKLSIRYTAAGSYATARKCSES